ncbi:Cupredoxin [Mycena pura]|uniref:Cupredoxin n=1 Tax=Mycena pura TaxID=153505 RepID=A0AAD6YAR1_9AGAR|nr:Cupredoxin [Mycena pura]
MVMAFTTFALALAFLPAAFAQSLVTVQVGPNGTLAYDPPSASVQPNDTIRFVFNPKNHTVTQSSFTAPCVPLAGGANSGFHFVSNVSAFEDHYDWIVAGDGPFWFYCEQTNPKSHCGAGMVFAVNPTANKTFAEFQALAIKLNGTASASASSTASSAFATPPAQSWATATATVTHGSSTWTTVYTSYDGTPQPTFAPSPVDHKIFVGKDGLTFEPNEIQAAINDTVTFEFHPKNHTVTQSSFPSPCVPLANTSTSGQVGFDSGFMAVSPNATVFPTFTITINDTAPIWGYCQQPGPPAHCGQGMVFAINAVDSGKNNFEAFQAIANGTRNTPSGSSSGSGAAPSSSSNSALTGLPVRSAGVLVGVVAAVAALL